MCLQQANLSQTAWRSWPSLDEERETRPFESWDEVDAIADELLKIYKPIPVVLVGSGLRPEELYGLEWRDVDLKAGVLNIERVYTQGVLKPCKKSDRQRRRVPLRTRVVEALEVMPRGFGQTPVFVDRRGQRINHTTFRMRHWGPALRAASLDHRGVYATRHTFATWSIRAGINLFYLSRVMGTSLTQIDRTYGHLVPDSDEYVRGLLGRLRRGGFGGGGGASDARRDSRGLARDRRVWLVQSLCGILALL